MGNQFIFIRLTLDSLFFTLNLGKAFEILISHTCSEDGQQKYQQYKATTHRININQYIIFRNKVIHHSLIISLIYENTRQLYQALRNFRLKKMNEIVTGMNSFFTKLTKNQIQFQLSQHYALPKKYQSNSKAKQIKKIVKGKAELSPEKLKLLKEAFKKFRQSIMSSEKFKLETKQLNEKQLNKKLKSQWKRLTDEQQFKWSDQSKKKQLVTKKKNPQPKSNEKTKQNNKQQKQQKQNEKSE